MINNFDNTEETLLIPIIAYIIVFLLSLLFYFKVYVPFSRERKYIITERKRSCDYEEYRYWKRELIKLYLAYIPIVGRFFR